MPATGCACGFTEQPDETLTDHLLEVFTPDDGIGKDGQAHHETTQLTCQCGFTAAALAALDDHFLEVFTPGDAIAPDATRHAPDPSQ